MHINRIPQAAVDLFAHLAKLQNQGQSDAITEGICQSDRVAAHFP